MVVVGGAHCALQPPVRRVEGVGPVGAPGTQARRPQPGPQRRLGVDAHVATGDVRSVVGVGDGPAHPLREPRGHGDGHGPARAQHPGQLGSSGGVVGDVLHDLGGDYPVERGVGEREVQGVAPRRRPRPCSGTAPAGSELASFRHGVEELAHVLQLGEVEVDGHDVGTEAGGLEGVASSTAPEVEHPVPGSQPKPVVADGQHCGVASCVPAWRAMTSRYWATVASAAADQL